MSDEALEVLDGLEPAVESDVPETEVPEVDAPEGAEPETPEGQEPADKQVPDARQLPKEVQRALKALRENPETAKVARELNDSFFRERAYQKHGTVAQIAEMASTIQQLGGAEGITAMRGEIDEYAQELSQFTEGNAEVLEKWAKQAPQGLIKLATPFLNKLYEIDNAAYGRAVAPSIAGTLRNYGIDQNGLQTLINSTDPAAKAIGAKLQELMGVLTETMRNAPKQDDAKVSELSKREQALLTRESNVQIRDVARDTIGNQNSLIDRGVAPLLKGRPLGTEAKADLITGIKGNLEKLFAADKTYGQHVSAALEAIKQGVKASKNVDEQKRSLTRYINAKTEELVPKAVRSTWNIRYGTAAPAKAAPNGKAAPAPAGKLNRAPKLAEMDKIPNYQNLWIMNKGKIKGREVTW